MGSDDDKMYWDEFKKGSVMDSVDEMMTTIFTVIELVILFLFPMFNAWWFSVDLFFFLVEL